MQANDSWRKSLSMFCLLSETEQQGQQCCGVWTRTSHLLLNAARRLILTGVFGGKEDTPPPITAGSSSPRNTVEIHRTDHLRSSKTGTANTLQPNALFAPPFSARHGGRQGGGPEHPTQDLEQTAESPQR
ncbi:hypothetical protein UPYG_G00107260 [Umbra pygmaea]|uniref:Uncharacterized protein n=1 Tax=Umbra pygmaea TaxID=75934 RepID=A0ABD0X5V5_UMBPY